MCVCVILITVISNARGRARITPQTNLTTIPTRQRTHIRARPHDDRNPLPKPRPTQLITGTIHSQTLVHYAPLQVKSSQDFISMAVAHIRLLWGARRGPPAPRCHWRSPAPRVERRARAAFLRISDDSLGRLWGPRADSVSASLPPDISRRWAPRKRGKGIWGKRDTVT